MIGQVEPAGLLLCLANNPQTGGGQQPLGSGNFGGDDAGIGYSDNEVFFAADCIYAAAISRHVSIGRGLVI